jgi:hypothetical protein
MAREAADQKADDDFAMIVAAIEHGRGIYANVRRFLTYHLTDNGGGDPVRRLGGPGFHPALPRRTADPRADIGTDTLGDGARSGVARTCHEWP